MAVGITIATIAVLMGGKSGGRASHFLIDAEKRIKTAVKDDARCKAALDEIGSLSTNLRKLETRITGHLKDYVRVHSDFQSAESDFDAVTELFGADQQEAANLILDARERLREQMTKEEWNEVFDSPD